MAIFSYTDSFKEHKDYIVLLKKALQTVKPGVEKKFLYYKQYPFGAKKLPLVLVDFDLNCKTVVTKAGHKPVAEGVVRLTDQEELDFDAKTGSLKRIRLQKYFRTMGPGIKPVFVPAGEVDDDGETEIITENQSSAAVNVASTVAPVVQPSPQPVAQPVVQPVVQPVAKPDVQAQPGPSRMDRKIEFEEAQFKLRQRIDELRKKTFSPAVEQLKGPALIKAAALASAGKFAEANELLDKLAKSAVSAAPTSAPVRPTTPAPTVAPARPTTPAPKLSAYMNATQDWKSAKSTAANGIFALKKAIFAACDPELETVVKAKIDSLNSILTVMDDAIIAKIQEAGGEADEERQVERNRALVQVASKQLAALRSHPLAAVADKNPFGAFTICSPVEDVLNRITSKFAA